MNRFVYSLILIVPVIGLDTAYGSPADSPSTDVLAVPADTTEPSLTANVGGSVRFNAIANDVDNAKLGDGEFTFDTFRINATGSYGDLFFSTEYAFYPALYGGQFLHHGYVGDNFTESFEAQVGVHQVPFGIQPYASHSWFLNLPYYAGLEDDYDAGIKAIFRPGAWTVSAAYYLNAENTDFTGGTSYARYSFDVVPLAEGDLAYVGVEGTRKYVEDNQMNLKVTYHLSRADVGSTTLGVSGQYGGLKYTGSSSGVEDGSHQAYAVHVHGQYNQFDLKTEYIQYEMAPPQESGQSDDFTVMAAYNVPYKVANEASIYTAGLSYTVPVDLGAVSSFQFYYDFTFYDKSPSTWNNSVAHNLGVLTTAGPLYLYTDLVRTKNHPFVTPGANYGRVLAEGSPAWHTTLNVNIGVYF